ncbi:MAG: GNAT superfamily N-acetyltransferase [Gammaproteobacteria bacterium]|jgi:GNAT superfamily N-acetyltransferase
MVYKLLAELYASYIDSFPLEKMHRLQKNLLVPNSGFWSFLAHFDNKVVGMINIIECSAVYAGGKFGEITELYLEPEYRSAQIGEKLIEKAKYF